MQSRHSLELRQHQQLALTPQLQQSLRYLQLSTHELQQEVSQALMENPLLESGDDYATDAPDTEAVAPAADTVADSGPEPEEHWQQAPRSAPRDAEDDTDRPEAAGEASLQEHLREQLRMTRASHRDTALVDILIEELDDSGYLATPLAEILTLLPAELDVDEGELQAALRLLQSFDPAGVAARSLAECLVLQLEHGLDTGRLSADAEVLRCARALASHHLDLLAAGNVGRLREALQCDQDTLGAAHALLLQLDPRPARQWAGQVADYAVPDVLVRKTRKGWEVQVNPAVLPKLRVNALYAQALEDAGPASAMQTQLQQAHGLIKSVSQRFATIVRVAQAVVDRQQEFFEKGLGAMRPLVLRDIAQLLEMHESTVSRATRQKYIQTPWGVYELKRFFGAALATESGQTTSATAVQLRIQQMVNEEPAGKPLSDSRIAEKLAAEGVVIARRTVAKYREAAGIASASLRKAQHTLR